MPNRPVFTSRTIGCTSWSNFWSKVNLKKKIICSSTESGSKNIIQFDIEKKLSFKRVHFLLTRPVYKIWSMINASKQMNVILSPPGPADISEYRHILYLFTFISSQRWQITKCTQEWFLVFRFWETLGELWHQRLQNKDNKNIWSPWFVKNHKKSTTFQSILCWISWDLT